MFKDLDPSSNYFFRIHTPHIISHSSHFNLECLPAAGNTLTVLQTILAPEGIILKLNRWVSLINSYNEIHYDQGSYFENYYADEFITAFEVIDEDAEINPFKFPQQLIIDKFLEEVEFTLEQNKDQYEVAELIAETRQVRKEITTSTKKALIKKISKILAKIRKTGINFIKEVLKDYLKDIGKDFLKSVTEGATRALMNP